VLAGFELTPTAPLGEMQRQRDQESRRSYRVKAGARRIAIRDDRVGRDSLCPARRRREATACRAPAVQQAPAPRPVARPLFRIRRQAAARTARAISSRLERIRERVARRRGLLLVVRSGHAADRDSGARIWANPIVGRSADRARYGRALCRHRSRPVRRRPDRESGRQRDAPFPCRAGQSASRPEMLVADVQPGSRDRSLASQRDRPRAPASRLKESRLRRGCFGRS
jgi:hypothetical protein